MIDARLGQEREEGRQGLFLQGTCPQTSYPAKTPPAHQKTACRLRIRHLYERLRRGSKNPGHARPSSIG
jgi:hypothetical protein